MDKITVSFAKKVPNQEEKFANFDFHASMEREIRSGLTEDQIKQEYHKCFKLIQEVVDEVEAEHRAKKAIPNNRVATQNIIPQQQPQQQQPQQQQQQQRQPHSNNSNNKGNWKKNAPASEKQLNWIDNLINGRAEIRALSNTEIEQNLLGVCNIRCTANNVQETLNKLTTSQANKLIKALRTKEKVS